MARLAGNYFVQLGGEALFDLRENAEKVPLAITEWLDVVSPLAS